MSWSAFCIFCAGGHQADNGKLNGWLNKTRSMRRCRLGLVPRDSVYVRIVSNSLDHVPYRSSKLLCAKAKINCVFLEEMDVNLDLSYEGIVRTFTVKKTTHGIDDNKALPYWAVPRLGNLVSQTYLVSIRLRGQKQKYYLVPPIVVGVFAR